MKFYFFYFNKTALHIAVEKGFLEIVELLLSRDNLDVNIKNIHNYFKIIKFEIILLIMFQLSCN